MAEHSSTAVLEAQARRRMPSRSVATIVSVAAASALVIAAVVALRPPHMEHWDEVQLELGMRRWDLAWHQPHPPGYVLFVLAGRLLARLPAVVHPGRVLSSLAALSWIAWIGARLPDGLDRATRAAFVLVLPLFVIASPTLLVHATTGRTYVVESVLWVSILLVATRRARPTPLVLGALVGVGGGFRPTLLGWGALVVAWWLWSERRASTITRRDVGQLVGSFAASTLGWIAALAALSGGLARYSELAAPTVRDNVLAKSLFVKGPAHVVHERLPAMLESVWTATGPILAVTLGLLVARLRRRDGAELRALDPLLYGSGVSFVFYLVVIYDSDGYSLSYVLPLVTWTALAGAALLARSPGAPGRKPLVAAGVAVLLAGWAFLPGGVLTQSGIPAIRARNEARFAARRAALATLGDAETLLVTGAEHLNGWSFRLLMYEAPERPVLQLAADPFFPLLRSEGPYLAAIGWQPRGVGPDGVELSTLPFYSPERPLRYVVFANPKETPERVDASCLKHAVALPVTPKEAFAVLKVGPALRVFARNGRLHCAA